MVWLIMIKYGPIRVGVVTYGYKYGQGSADEDKYGQMRKNIGKTSI